MKRYSFVWALVLVVFASPLCLRAYTSGLPGGSLYFRAATQKSIDQRQVVWDLLDNEIHYQAT
jgi:hypothetical protein